MKTVKVLMSTYNGGQYLSTQIESILNQQGVKVELYIRDDGSNEENKGLLKQYAGIENVHVEFGQNLGYQNSFLKLLEDNYENTDTYYSFSDQDDFWDKNKLIDAVNHISARTPTPVLYFSSLNVSDENLKFIEKKELNKRNLNLGSAITRSNIPGCTMVFNNYLAKKVVEFKGKQSLKIGHDAWVQLVCAAYNGDFVYGQNSHISYRRSQSSLTNTSKSIVTIVMDEKRRMKKNPNKAFEISKIILENDVENLSYLNKTLLEQVINYRKDFKNKMSLIRNTEKNTGNKLIDSYNLLLIMLNKY